jgi:hypothetical protein
MMDANIARNEYFKEYRKNNKDKIKNINEKYWDKKAKENNEGKQLDLELNYNGGYNMNKYDFLKENVFNGEILKMFMYKLLENLYINAVYDLVKDGANSASIHEISRHSMINEYHCKQFQKLLKLLECIKLNELGNRYKILVEKSECHKRVNEFINYLRNKANGETINEERNKNEKIETEIEINTTIDEINQEIQKLEKLKKFKDTIEELSIQNKTLQQESEYLKSQNKKLIDQIIQIKERLYAANQLI